MRQSNPNFTNGVPELLILRLLLQREMYGYEVVQAIRERSDHAFAFGEGVVYPVLHGLEKDGALTARRKTVAGRCRVYYTLTPLGNRRLEGMAADWSRLADAIRGFLAGAPNAETV